MLANYKLAKGSECTHGLDIHLNVSVQIGKMIQDKCVHNGVFHVFHVNRSVNIFLLNRKIFYVTKIC